MIYSQNKLTCPSARQKLSPHLATYVKCMAKNMPYGLQGGHAIHGIFQLEYVRSFARILCINRNKDNYPWYNPFTLPAAAPWLLSGSASVAAANCSRLQPEDQESQPRNSGHPHAAPKYVCMYTHVLYNCMYTHKPIYIQYSMQTKCPKIHWPDFCSDTPRVHSWHLIAQSSSVPTVPNHHLWKHS